MNRDKIGTQKSQYTKRYVDVHSPNLVSVHFYTIIPILHFIFPKFFVKRMYYVRTFKMNALKCRILGVRACPNP